MTGESAKDWHVGHPTLFDGNAPHETRAVMRLHRGGWPGSKIAETLKMSGSALVKELQVAMDEEGAAHRENRKIWDARAPRGSV